jgi:hypothetical protein
MFCGFRDADARPDADFHFRAPRMNGKWRTVEA